MSESTGKGVRGFRQATPSRRAPKTEHLVATQWKKGQSGNPSGRPAVPWDIRQRLKDAAPSIVERMIDQALTDGDDSATVEVRKYLLNRLYGTPEVQSRVAVEQAGADFGAVIQALIGRPAALPAETEEESEPAEERH